MYTIWYTYSIIKKHVPDAQRRQYKYYLLMLNPYSDTESEEDEDKPVDVVAVEPVTDLPYDERKVASDLMGGVCTLRKGVGW